MKSSKRVVYVQYTNPAGYPPLEHSSQMFAEAGWDVLFLGIESWGSASFRLPKRKGIRVRQLPFRPSGWLQKLHYVAFCLWCIAWTLWNRTGWVYASELLSCPVAAILSVAFRIRVVYHEHDSPEPGGANGFLRFCMWARNVCARRAAMCILPNQQRAVQFSEHTQVAKRPVIVWNCPRLYEVRPPQNSEPARVRLLYHGSIVPERLPMTIIDALSSLPDGVTLTVVGYETVGSAGYLKALHGRGKDLGVAHRLEIIGPVESRVELLNICARHDVGLALMPLIAQDMNLRAMTGASNKPFDYLACGLALLTSKLPDWEQMFVDTRYGLACDPAAVESLVSALRWFYDHPEEMRTMGERGRKRILKEWNYESQFAPVLQRLTVSQC